jgi:hypothetical protein
MRRDVEAASEGGVDRAVCDGVVGEGAVLRVDPRSSPLLASFMANRVLGGLRCARHKKVAIALVADERRLGGVIQRTVPLFGLAD